MMSYLNKIVLLFWLVFISYNSNLKGQVPDDYLQYAGENNPGLKAVFMEYHAALERVPQVASLPDPELSFGLFLKPMERYTGNQVAEVSLMQMFPWFGTLSTAKEEAALLAKAKYEKFREHKAELYFDVKKTWWELYFVHQEIAVLNEQIQILRTIEETANVRLSGGGNSRMGKTGSLSDVLRLQLEINDLNTKKGELIDKSGVLKQTFNQLLNRPSDSEVTLAETESDVIGSHELALLFDSVKVNNPMLQSFQYQQGAFMAMEDKNRKKGMPMIGVGVSYGIFEPRPGNESMMNGNNMFMPMVSVSIPLWRGKYRASVQEAKFLQQSALFNREDTENMLITRFSETVRDLKDAERRYDHFVNQTELAEQVLQVMMSEYSSTGAQFEEILRLHNSLYGYRLGKERAFVDKNLAVSRFEKLTGL